MKWGAQNTTQIHDMYLSNNNDPTIYFKEFMGPLASRFQNHACQSHYQSE